MTLRRTDKQIVIILIACSVIISLFEGYALAEILPAQLAGGKWRREGKAACYTQENLHLYINGEAELYFPYGFGGLESAFFAASGKPATDGLAIDLFLMGSRLDAFGIYSRYRSPDADIVKVGADGIASDSQVLFCKGAYFVRIALSGDIQATRSELVAVAAEVARTIPGVDELPPEIALLHIPKMVPRSERFDGSGLLGYRFLGSGLSADVAIEGKEAKIFILLAPSPQAAAVAFERYLAYLKDKGVGTMEDEEQGARTVTATDPLYKLVAVRFKNGRVFGALRLPKGESGPKLLADLEVRLNTQ